MTPKDTKPQRAPAVPSLDSKSVFVRQLIASAIAVAIVGLGAWSLLGQKAPYHPAAYNDEVTRGSPSGLTTFLGND